MSAIAFEQEPRTMTHGQERAFHPIKLRALLARRSISHVDLAAAIKKKNGRPLSRTALSFLMNYGDWPMTTPAAAIKEQVEKYLAGRGVCVEELADIWQHDEFAQDALNHRNAHGAHAYPRRRDAQHHHKKPSTSRRKRCSAPLHASTSRFSATRSSTRSAAPMTSTSPRTSAISARRCT
jgi:hypothetical protein